MELVTKALSCSSPSGAFQQLGAEMDIISFNPSPAPLIYKYSTQPVNARV